MEISILFINPAVSLLSAFMYYLLLQCIWWKGADWNGFTLSPFSNSCFPWKVTYSEVSVSVQFSSAAPSCLTLCDPMNRSMPGLPVHHQLPEFTQTHVHWVDDAIQPFHLLLSHSPPALSLSQHQGFFKWVSSSHQVAKVLEFQLQHQSFQWIFRTDLL